MEDYASNVVKWDWSRWVNGIRVDGYNLVMVGQIVL